WRRWPALPPSPADPAISVSRHAAADGPRNDHDGGEPAMRGTRSIRIVAVGAAGRMGQTLVRTIHTSDGVTVAGAIERPGSPHLGKEPGEIAGGGAERGGDTN